MSNTKLGQKYGEVNIEMVKGDALSFNVDFNMNLTGYAFEARVILPGTNKALTVNVVDISTGVLNVVCPDTLVLTSGRHHWGFSWITPAGNKRTVLYGNWEVLDG